MLNIQNSSALKRTLAIVLLVLSLAFLYFMKNKREGIEKTTASVESDNSALQTRVEELTKLYNNREFYQTEAVRLVEEAEEVLEEFPSEMYIEDKVLFIQNLFDDEMNEYHLDELSYGGNTFIMNASYTEEDTMELYSIPITADYIDLSYDEAISLINFGLSSDNRFVCKSFNISFDEDTGKLRGSVSYDTFYIVGQKDPYVFPQEVLDSLGTLRRGNNMFGDFIDSDN